MEYRISDYSTYATGETEATVAIQKAIDTCHAGGGGRVVVPPGLYAIGSLQLRDHVDLHLSSGATLRGIYGARSYRPIDPACSPMMAQVFACDAVDVSISGSGTIDGQGARYWKKLDQDKPHSTRPDLLKTGVSGYWYERLNDKPKPDRVVAFLRCRDVSLTGIRITGATEWTCHLAHSENIKIRGLNIDNPLHGPNTDGIDIDGSSDVLISDCTICTGDDAIVLKTKNIFGRPRTIRNVCVTNCRLTTTCNGFKIGTETFADVENICFSNTIIYSAPQNAAIERCISGIAIETVDGGNVRNVTCNNIVIDNARTALFIRRGERLHGGRGTPGALQRIMLSNIVATSATHPSVMSGIPGHPIEDVSLMNVHFETVGGDTRSPEKFGTVPECPDEYPEVFMFGDLPAAVLYARHVDRFGLQACCLRTRHPDPRPVLVTENTKERCEQTTD